MVSPLHPLIHRTVVFTIKNTHVKAVLHCSGINCTVQMSVLSKLTNQSNPSRSVFIGTGKLSKIYTEIDAQNRFEKDRRLILRFTTKLL